jgi:hypothetical protein
MRTGLRGYGSPKKELLQQIHKKEGMNPFKFSDVKDLPAFSRKKFFKLVFDDYILIYKRGNPALYALNKPPVIRCKSGQTADEWFGHEEPDTGVHG